jgi:hypothetical protein
MSRISADRGGVEMRIPVWRRERRMNTPASAESGRGFIEKLGDWRSEEECISELGVKGKVSDAAEWGNKGGRVGRVNGIGEKDGELERDSMEKVDDVGEIPGVLRRTKLDIGVLADRSDAEP